MDTYLMLMLDIIATAGAVAAVGFVLATALGLIDKLR